MSTLLRSSLLAVAIVAGLVATGREARAQQAQYVGTFVVTNLGTTNILSDPGNSPNATTGIVSEPYAALLGQEWAFILLPNGFFVIQNAESDLVLEASANFGVSLQVDQNRYTATANQMWYLYPLGNQFYILINAATGYVLSDPFNGVSSGNPVLTTSYTASTIQFWHLQFLRY